MKKKYKFIVITLVLLSIMPLITGCSLPYRYEYEEATAIMENKSSVTGGVNQPDDYYVYLRAGELTRKISNHALYRQFEKGKEINVYIEKAFDNNNQLISKSIVLYKPEDR